MTAPNHCSVLGIFASVLLSGIVLSKGAVHGEVPELIQTCGSRLDWIYSTRYPAPRSPTDLNCSGIIKTALATRVTHDCPAEADVVKCFNRARPLWVAFLRDCELFSLPYPCTLNEGACIKPGGEPAHNSSTPAKVEGESRRKAKAEGEAEGRRHMLSYRRLFAESEGEGGAQLANGPLGCFPDFYSSQDFDDWLQGKYQVPDYAIGSKLSPAGIIIWILHALGILLMVRV